MLDLGKEEGASAADFTQGTRDGLARFSPDGQAIAFLRPDGKDRRQIWMIPANGGEAQQLTHSPGNVVDFAWAPDSQRVAFAADVDPQASKDGQDDTSLPRVTEATRIKYRYDGLGWRGDAHFHLFVVDARNGETTQVTDGDWDDLQPVWSPDGSKLAFISSRRENRDFTSRSEAYVLEVGGAGDGGAEPECWSVNLESVGALGWSPDGQRLVVAGSPDKYGLGLWQSWLYILEPGKEPRRITNDSVRPYLGLPAISATPELRWRQDGHILFLAEARGESCLVEVAAEGGEARRLAGGGMLATAMSLDRSGARAVVATNAPDSPADLRLVDLDAGAMVTITNHNQEFLAEHPPARQEKFTIQRGEWDIECRLYFPPEFDPSQQYPLALEIHGGPNGAFYDSFVPLQQMLATSGYLVLAVNPRGSSTYGNDFMLAVLDDWGGEDYLDLMAAVDEVVARPYVDGARMGLHGYSYGGFMSSWIVGRNRRFKAAVVGAPCTDLVGMYGTSDIGVSFGEVQWGGTFEEAYPKLVERSPITYVPDVEAPVLLLHGESDLRCPISQSEAYFVRMKRLGKTVEMVRFPGSYHAFPRTGHPKLREEYLARTLNWFNRYV